MKKIFLLLLMAAATLASAQCYTKFKGIEIKGNMEDFDVQLQKQGYKLQEQGLFCYVYEGKFMGADVAVVVHYTLKSRTAYSVSVTFDDKDTRELVNQRYYGLQELLIGKYGKPAEKDVPYEITKGEYTSDICTRWKDDCGGITLKNTHLTVSKYESLKVVIITYWSKEGYDLYEVELSEDL